jgi:hypothetical protein
MGTTTARKSKEYESFFIINFRRHSADTIPIFKTPKGNSPSWSEWGVNMGCLLRVTRDLATLPAVLQSVF